MQKLFYCIPILMYGIIMFKGPTFAQNMSCDFGENEKTVIYSERSRLVGHGLKRNCNLKLALKVAKNSML